MFFYEYENFFRSKVYEFKFILKKYMNLNLITLTSVSETVLVLLHPISVIFGIFLKSQIIIFLDFTHLIAEKTFFG